MSADHDLRPGGSASLAGRPVARMGFGAMQLPGPGVFGPPRDRAAALAVLRRAVEAGANHVDTAHFYGPDVANELIRAALHPYPDDVVLVSKVGAARDDQGNWLPAQRPEQLRAGVEENLRALDVECLDVVNLRRHDEAHAGGGEGGDGGDGGEGGEGGEGREQGGAGGVDLDSQLAEMAAMRDEGKIRAIGMSNVTGDELRRGLPLGIACVQNAYNVLERADELLLALCAELDVAWVPFFPLGSAFPGRAFPGRIKVTDDPVVVEVAADAGATPAQVALAWLLAHDPHVLLIPGTSSLEHLEENLAAGKLQLSGQALARLDALSDAKL